MQKEGTEGALPGLGLTEEQLFFAGFARVGIPMLVSLFTRACAHILINVPNIASHNHGQNSWDTSTTVRENASPSLSPPPGTMLTAGIQIVLSRSTLLGGGGGGGD